MYFLSNLSYVKQFVSPQICISLISQPLICCWRGVLFCEKVPINYKLAQTITMSSYRRSEADDDHPFDDNRQQQQYKVYIRNRPLRNQFAKRCLKIIDHGVALNFKGKVFPLYFDGVFDENSTQDKVFKEACLPALENVIRGNNASLFVYGQTGTGKTYTMGTLQAIKSQDQGLIPLSLNYLINYFESAKPNKEWSISLSFMQIYMEEIYDLLNPRNGKLKIREDLEYGQTYVEDLIIVPISNYQQSVQLINAGLEYRKTGNQKMNAVSSRSHTILTLYVSQKISDNQYMSSTFSLIDLAGSERVKKTNSIDLRLEEAKFINTSLSALGNVISQLAVNDSDRFIPYRSSKLTRILKNSLSGKSKITVICTLEISQSNLYETYSTLLFADRCKQIRLPNQPVISIETFDELDQQKDLKIALEKSKQKQQEYLEIIKNLEMNGGGKSTRQTQRETELSNIIESIYRLFTQINDHLKKVLEPQTRNQSKKQVPKVLSTTSIPAIKGNITKYAQETIDRINSLSTIAFGEGKASGPTSYSRPQAEALLALLLENMRHNVKLQESILIKDGKESLQKEIALEEYEKDKKQEVITTLKNKKLNSLVNHLEEIWSQRTVSTNPLQSLLNNIRRGEMSYYGERTQSVKNATEAKEFTNPKQFLKHLTRQQSERRHKEILIEEGRSDDGDDDRDDEQSKEEEVDRYAELTGSQVRYFQKTNTPIKSSKGPEANKKSSQTSNAKEQSNGGGNSEIKKLLESLIVSKSLHEEKKRVGRSESSSRD